MEAKRSLGVRVLPVWTGVALSSPFLADLIGWRLSITLVIPWLFLCFVARPKLEFIPPILALLGLVAAHLVALALSETPFAMKSLRDITLSCLLIAIAATASRATFQSITRGFFLSVIAVGVCAATIGLLKHGLQDRGYLLGPFIAACPGQYPQGSNLCTDYNLLGMLLLVSMTGAATWRAGLRSKFSLLLLTILIAAGLTVGSRRFLLLLPVFFLGWAWIEIRTSGTSSLRTEVPVMAAVLLGAWALVSLVTAPEIYETYRFGKRPLTVLFNTEGESASPPNRAYPGVIAATILSEGLSTRMDRWQLGANLVLEKPILGHGFYYHDAFSHRFNGRLGVRDYPHLPLLSAGVLGGVGLMGIVLWLYIRLGLLALLSSRSVVTSGAPLAFILTSGVAIISGDTIFSIPQWIAMALLLAICTSNYKIIRDR